ncbi:MAG: response regulator transcription factor [Clostridia bacterium]
MLEKILVVDDEANIVEVVQAYLEAEGFRVFSAANGREALAVFAEVEPHLVLLDLMLPDLSGEDVCIQLRKTSRVPIIMLTAKVTEEAVLHGLEIGADDYVTKPFSPRQLMARVKALLRRADEEKGRLAHVLESADGVLQVDLTKHLVKAGDFVANVTPNEFNLLSLFMRNPQRVFTREELIEKCFGDEYEGFDRVIDTHIKNLRQKIELDSRDPKYIKTVHGVGYTFGGGSNEV